MKKFKLNRHKRKQSTTPMKGKGRDVGAEFPFRVVSFNLFILVLFSLFILCSRLIALFCSTMYTASLFKLLILLEMCLTGNTCYCNGCVPLCSIIVLNFVSGSLSLFLFLSSLTATINPPFLVGSARGKLGPSLQEQAGQA